MAQSNLAEHAEAMATAQSTLQDLYSGGLSDLVEIARLEGEARKRDKGLRQPGRG